MTGDDWSHISPPPYELSVRPVSRYLTGSLAHVAGHTCKTLPLRSGCLSGVFGLAALNRNRGWRACHLRQAGNEPGLRLLPGSGHDLAEAGDEAIGELAADLAERIQPRELPPVLVAIESPEGGTMPA